jgi:hypothetical protein
VDEPAAFKPRRVCSDAERRLAVWAHDDLRARGHEAWLETHWVRPQLALALALGCGLTVTGGLVAIAAPLPGLALALLGAVSVLADVAGRSGPLRLLLPRRATQVVLVEPLERLGGAPAATTVDLLVTARTDVPRQGLARRLERVPGGLCWLAPCAPAVVAAAAARMAGADGALLGAAQLAPTIVLLIAVGGALDAAAGPDGDGRAQDAALTAALGLHDELVRDPPPGVAAGLLLAGPDALRAHLRRERLRPERTALLHVRAGDTRSRHPQWRAAADAAGLPVRERGPRGLPAALAPPERAARLARALAETL